MVIRELETLGVRATTVTERGYTFLVSTIKTPEPSRYGGYRYETAILQHADAWGVLEKDEEEECVVDDHRYRTQELSIALVFHNTGVMQALAFLAQRDDAC